MHVLNLTSPAPAQSAARSGRSQESGFGSVYDAKGAPAAEAKAAPARDTARDAPPDTAKTESQRDPAPDANAAKGAADPGRRAPGHAEEAPLVEAEGVVPGGPPEPVVVKPAKTVEEITSADRVPLAAAENAEPRVAATLRNAEADAATIAPAGAKEAASPRGESVSNAPVRAPEQAPNPTVSGAAPAAPSHPNAAEAPQVQGAAQPVLSDAQQTVQSAEAAKGRAEEVVVRRVGGGGSPDSTAPADTRAERASRSLGVEAAKPVMNAGDPAWPAMEQARPDGVDPAIADIAPAEGRSTAEHVAKAEATVRHDTPRPVMQQVAEAARALREGPVELTLQPEELGKVRMTLSAGADGTMTMSLQAERPETLDLLRRHIGELARELADMGIENLNFSFGQDRAPADRQRELPAGEDASDRTIAAIPLAQHGFAGRSTPTGSIGGLDLRL